PGMGAWRFSSSFPDLPVVDAAGPARFMDNFRISDAAFVLATQNGSDAASGVPISAGLNFISTLKPLGVIGLFDALVATDVLLYGTIVMPTITSNTGPVPPLKYAWQLDVPGIRLQADLGVQVALSN